MRRASQHAPGAEKTLQDIRRTTRRHHSAEEKIRIVLEGLRGEVSIAELCRKEGGTSPTLAVVVNAGVDALADYGVTHIEMPVTPEPVWRPVRGGQARSKRHGTRADSAFANGLAFIRRPTPGSSECFAIRPENGLFIFDRHNTGVRYNA
jgi:hypothetical protein